MSKRFRHSASASLQLATVLLAASPCFAGSWANNAPFGATLQGDLYSPTTPGASPAVLVAIHYCTGNKAGVHSWFESAAEKNGFYIIAPDAGKQCFDSSATRGGDRDAIVKMVQYVITNKSADKNRVFAAGLSSGGCMTNTLLAIYPDVFAGGSAMPGFTAGGWPAGDTSCTKCCTSNCPQINTDGKYWGDIARNAFAFSGTRPCVQEWVGGGDQYHFNDWLPAVAAQFQNLSNLGSGTAGTGAPSGWTRTVYKDSSGNVRLETNLGPASQQHDLSSAGLFGYVVSFLGLDKPTGSCGVASTGTGGAGGAGPTTGGASSAAGGSLATGGKANAGGTTSTGGTTTVNAGGTTTVNAGGTTTVNAGGTTSTGGKANAGGTTSTGGKANAGGTTSTGGSTSTSNTGGSNPSTGNGGATQTGGTSASSTTGNGGSTTTSSNSSSGGVLSSSGGASSSSTSTGSGNTTATGTGTLTPADAGGCSCHVAGGHQAAGTLFGLILAGFGTLLRRRRRNVA